MSKFKTLTSLAVVAWTCGNSVMRRVDSEYEKVDPNVNITLLRNTKCSDSLYTHLVNAWRMKLTKGKLFSFDGRAATNVTLPSR